MELGNPLTKQIKFYSIVKVKVPDEIECSANEEGN